ncbi:MAG: tetratricopeptide repeat protein [Gammaproteobacteria bacterium]|nr:MAG: tetratricopeptide repeat protein [Gammaproteobacteria bacterium]
MSSFTLLASLVLVSAALASCAGGFVKKNPADTTAKEPVQAETSAGPDPQNLPNVELTAELMYKLLLSDIARQQNRNDLALATLVDTAIETRDPRLAAQATRQAVISSQYGTAIQMARLWLELVPDNLDVHQTMGNLLIVEKQPEQALAHYSKALTLADEKNRSLLLKQISGTLVRYSSPQQALELIEKLATEYPGSADVALALASVASKLKEYGIAATAIDRTLSLDPDNSNAATFKFGLLLLNKKTSEAEQFAGSFLKKHPTALLLRTALARHYLETNKLKQAEKEYLVIHKQDETSIIAPMSLALIRIDSRKLDDATMYLEKVLLLQPDNDLARLYLGDIAAQQKKLDDAIQWYRSVTEKGQLFKARLRLVNVILQRDGVDAAMRELEAIHAESPSQQVDTILLQQDLLIEAGREDEALQIINTALADSPDEIDLLYARAMIAARREDIAGLEKDLKHLLKIKPDHAQALNAYGFTLADLTDRYKEAYSFIEAALKQKPGDPFILDSMGWVEYRMGNYRAGEDYLRTALAKRNDPEIAAHLVEVLLATGKARLAKKVWAKANKDFPDDEKLRAVGEKLHK